MNPMQKNTKILVVVGVVVAILVGFLAVSPNLSPIGSGSGWEIDYVLSEVTLDGVTYAQELGETDSEETTYTGGGGGGGRYPVLLSFVDKYQFREDPDGEPRLEGYVWQGLASLVYVTVSQWRRVDSSGNVLAFQQDDPNQVAHELTDTVMYEYYYEFEIRCGTESDQFPTTLNTQSAECSEVDATVLVTVSLQETIFGEVNGFFQDATLVEYDHIDLQLQSGLAWAITPAVNPRAAGSALEVQNRVETDASYDCEVIIPFSMNAGLVRSGSDNLRYDVWVEYTTRFTILLEAPLDIGTQGETGLTGGEAPIYSSPFDWRLVLIIGVAMVFIIAMFYIFMRFRKK
jgi:hypothetical protein